ncbi:hypothetical protein BGZ81_004731 [Podila clonocystis]|nr:hypothetical protein BGZ81_004731 [Podila clonocystis]
MAAQSIPIPPTNSGGKTPRWTQPVSFYGQSVFSKYYAQSICVFLMLVPFLVMPVASQQTPIDNSGCIASGSFDAAVDYFPNKIHVDNGALFSVRYEKNYKVVTNTAPGQNVSYVLTQCGTPAPNASLFSNTTLFFNVPIKSAASIATTAVAYVEMLGRRSALKAVDTEGLVSSPCVQLGLDKGEIKGLEDKNLTLRAEQFGAVDLVFSTSGSEPGTTNKTVVTSDVTDPGPLNRAEWLEFYATFFNLEESAQVLTASINNNYNCFKSAANAKDKKPVVAWAQFTAASQFNNNAASWSFSPAPYKRILTEDAGATFFNGTNKASFATAAEFAAAATTVDVLIDETFIGDSWTAFLQNYNLTESSDLKFIKNKAVFRQDGLVNPNDGRDWFASAVAMNDAVLQDVIRTVHPEILPAKVAYNWIRNVATETKQVLTSANCTQTDANKPVPDRALVCKDIKLDGDKSAAGKTVAGALTAVLGLLAIVMSL